MGSSSTFTILFLLAMPNTIRTGKLKASNDANTKSITKVTTKAIIEAITGATTKSSTEADTKAGTEATTKAKTKAAIEANMEANTKTETDANTKCIKRPEINPRNITLARLDRPAVLTLTWSDCAITYAHLKDKADCIYSGALDVDKDSSVLVTGCKEM